MYVIVDSEENLQFVNSRSNIKGLTGKVISNPENEDLATLKENGIYRYIKASRISSHQNVTERSHEIDHENAVVREIVETENKDVSKLREKKKRDLLRQLESKIRECDHIVLEALEAGQNIPTKCKDYRKALRDAKQDIPNNLDQLNTAEEVINYSPNLPEEDL
jgi:SepF-like predicted cell division protein (DUF552 family)